MQAQPLISVLRRCITYIILLFITLSASAQINTKRVLDIGRNALYYDDYVLSIHYFNMIINSRPYMYEPYYYRALAKFYLEDYLGTELDCTRAIDRNPYYYNSYELRGLSRIHQEHYHDAIQDYQKASEIEPNNRNVWHNLILCQIEVDSLDAADKTSDIYIRKWPRSASGYCMKAQVHMQKKDTVSADSILDKALEVDRFNTSAITMKAQLHMYYERYAEAEKNLNEAIRLQPKDVGSYINRALSRYHQNNYRGAMKDYDFAIELDSTNFIGHYNRGLLRANVGEDNLALQDFDFIIQRRPSDMMAVFNRATLRENTGDYSGAIQDYTTVIKEYPKFLYGYERRAAARRKIGDKKGALQDEDHILKEQIAHRYGYSTPTSRMKNKTRKESDDNLDDYNKLVVADEDDEKVYESEIRGKVQNHDTEVKLLGYLQPYATLAQDTYINEAIALYNQSNELFLQGDTQKAIDTMTAAIQKYPQLGQAYYNRGIMYLLTEQKDIAVLDLSKAGELGIYQAYNIIKKNKQKK